MIVIVFLVIENNLVYSGCDYDKLKLTYFTSDFDQVCSTLIPL